MPGLTHAYYSLYGEIQGERNISTGEYTHYSTDALGSVSPMSGDKFDRCRYKPYGATLAGSPGTFGWVGSWGYAATGRSVSSHYVRARHYSTATRAWTTVDPLWPDEASYLYCAGGPIDKLDLLGLQPESMLPKCCKEKFVQTVHQGIKPCKREWLIMPACTGLLQNVMICGASLTSLCSALEQGNCWNIAYYYGVPPEVLCAMAISEQSIWEKDPLWKQIYDEAGTTMMPKTIPVAPPIVSEGARLVKEKYKDPSAGCAQLRASEVRRFIDSALKCGYLAYAVRLAAIIEGKSDLQIRQLLIANCSFGVEIRALQMKMFLSPDCNPGEKKRDAKGAYARWAGGGDLHIVLESRADCIERALRAWRKQ